MEMADEFDAHREHVVTDIYLRFRCALSEYLEQRGRTECAVVA